MLTFNLDFHDFHGNINNKLKELLPPHHFIYKHQQLFLQNCKENFDGFETLMILDFAESYTLRIQDVVQSFHLNNAQASIHHLVIYFKNHDKLQHKNLVCISDQMQHVFSVYAFQTTVIHEFIKVVMPQINKIIYFSDGCSGQYKNHKNIANLLHHNVTLIYLLNGIFCNL